MFSLAIGYLFPALYPKDILMDIILFLLMISYLSISQILGNNNHLIVFIHSPEFFTSKSHMLEYFSFHRHKIKEVCNDIRLPIPIFHKVI